MARVEINNGGHQVVVDDPNGERNAVARDARKLWEKTKAAPNGVGFNPKPVELVVTGSGSAGVLAPVLT